MSEADRASIAALSRLRTEVAIEREMLAPCLRDIDEADARLAEMPSDRAARALCAYALHRWYTALEAIFERIARQLDGALPGGDRWHRELLLQMATEIPGVRPALVSTSLRGELQALLAFRGFFRHAYGVDLDAARLRVEAERVRRIAADVDRALDAFDEFVAGSIAELIP